MGRGGVVLWRPRPSCVSAHPQRRGQPECCCKAGMPGRLQLPGPGRAWSAWLPLTPCPSACLTGLFNMVFAVSPPWGPWSDNIVPLVRLSRCLIRTASGASPTPASGSPLSGLRRRVRTLEKETKDLDSIEVFLLLPREPGIRETDGGLWAQAAAEHWGWPKEPCVWP